MVIPKEYFKEKFVYLNKYACNYIHTLKIACIFYVLHK